MKWCILFSHKYYQGKVHQNCDGFVCVWTNKLFADVPLICVFFEELCLAVGCGFAGQL